MNLPIIDPLQGDFPEAVEEFLEHGIPKCIAFNRRGTLLAAGCFDGSCVIWDFDTRTIAKELRDEDSVTPITSVSWSKCGNRVLVSATNKSLTLWDVVKGKKMMRVVLQQPTLLAHLHPGTHLPYVCLACPLSSGPMIVDLDTELTTILPVAVSDAGNGLVPSPPCSKSSLVGIPTITPTVACFNKPGDLVYVGNCRGEILIVEYENIRVLAVVPVSGSAVIKNIACSRNGQHLLTNSNDRTIRIYKNLLPTKDEVGGALESTSVPGGEVNGEAEKLRAVGAKCLSLCHDFQDSVTKMQWRVPSFSGDGEWVIGGYASKDEHKIYIWDRVGHLVKILEGPKEGLIDLAWHPVYPIIVSVSLTGVVYIWAKEHTENWSAFAPDFKELEENEEYVEREDDFDLNRETDKVKDCVNEDEEVDIITMDKDDLDDSDISQELCYLPAVPSSRSIPEEENQSLRSCTNVGSNQYGSLSDEAAHNGGQAMMTPAPGPLTDGAADNSGSVVHFKRKRKPSEKGLELQAEKIRKPLKHLKASSGRFSKTNKKSIVSMMDACNGASQDDISY